MSSPLAVTSRRWAAQSADVFLSALGLVEPRVQSLTTVKNRPVEPAPDDVIEGPMTRQAVEDILDDYVRPALQQDGGDISLIRIDGADLYIRLVGACSSCPSSTATLQGGVERLLREEFPMLGDIVQVGAYEL
jgi:Fe-S cluster biogenesis protein NfuA